MNIVVCVKYVPDATADRRFEDDNTVDRFGVDGLLSELDEYAVEQALQVKEKVGDDTEVTVLSVGPEQATDAIRKALQMGADKGVHVVDDAIAGSDALATSLVLAEAVKKIDHELVVCGMASTDGSMGVVPAMLAERLDVPAVTLGSEIEVDGTTVRVRRDGDAATETIEGTLPLVLSVTDQSGALPLLQGDHGREEEAGGDLVAERPGCRRRDGRPVRGMEHRRGHGGPPPAHAGRGRHRRGRLGRHRAGRVPRVEEVHLRRAG